MMVYHSVFMKECVCMEYKLSVFLFPIMSYLVIFLKAVYIVLLTYFRLGKHKKKELLLSVVTKHLLTLCRFPKHHSAAFTSSVSAQRHQTSRAV